MVKYITTTVSVPYKKGKTLITVDVSLLGFMSLRSDNEMNYLVTGVIYDSKELEFPSWTRFSGLAMILWGGEMFVNLYFMVNSIVSLDIVGGILSTGLLALQVYLWVVANRKLKTFLLVEGGHLRGFRPYEDIESILK